MGNTLSQLSTELCAYLRTTVPALAWVDQDFNQLDRFEYNAGTSFPAALIDFPEAAYSQTTGLSQAGDITITVRLCFAPLYDQQTPPVNLQSKAAAYYALEQAVFEALQGWSTEAIRPLARTAAHRESASNGNNALHVRVLTFASSYEDEVVKPAYQTIAAPLTIGI